LLRKSQETVIPCQGRSADVKPLGFNQFPWIVNQYIGASAWFGDHWKLSMGVNVMNGRQLKGRTIPFAIAGFLKILSCFRYRQPCPIR
jgi:hypothetical protein